MLYIYHIYTILDYARSIRITFAFTVTNTWYSYVSEMVAMETRARSLSSCKLGLAHTPVGLGLAHTPVASGLGHTGVRVPSGVCLDELIVCPARDLTT